MEKKHFFTPSEKREFLKILKKYGHIVGSKCSDGNTLRRKTIAWNRIACEYNTSSIAPYPASSKQLRRLWMNLKQRNKLSLGKMELEPTSDEFQNEDGLEAPEVEEETSTAYFVNVGGSDTQDDSLKTNISGGNNQNDTFTATDSEERAFDVEFIDESVEHVKLSTSGTDIGLNQIKKNLLVREYQDRKRRQNELHMLQKRLLMEQVREARAKANLAELELRQQRYLES